jgi:hypothetical protein
VGCIFNSVGPLALVKYPELNHFQRFSTQLTDQDVVLFHSDLKTYLYVLVPLPVEIFH